MSSRATSRSPPCARRYALPARFLLSPAPRSRHKNYSVLVSALARLRREGRPLTVVATGSGTDHAYWGPDLIGLGYVPSADLAALRALASGLVQTTLYEAGSFPVFEAMLAGLPVACSRIPALSEQLERDGAFAELFDPADPDDLARALSAIWRPSPEDVRRFYENASRVGRRTWIDVAGEYLEVLTSAARGGSGADGAARLEPAPVQSGGQLMSISSLKMRVRRAVLSPLRPAVDRVLDELSHRQELSASATQESLEALAAGTRLLRGSVLELADDLRAGPGGPHAAGELALLRAAALGAVAGSGRPAVALALGEGVGEDLAALGIAAADAAGSEPVSLIVAVSSDLSETVAVDRLAAGGTLVLAVGRGAAPARIAALTETLTIDGSAAIVPAGGGFDSEPNDPSRADVSRLIVARRPP